MKRSLCISPLFILVPSVNCLYIANKEVCSQSVVWRWGIFVLGLHKLLWHSLAYRIGSLFPLGGPVVSVTLVGLVVSCGGEEQFTPDTRINRGLMHRDLSSTRPHTDYTDSP
jgi:hypothetical protein